MITFSADKPFTKTDTAQFLPPRDRHYPMDVAWAAGTVGIGDTSTDFNTHNWFGWVEGGVFKIKREGDTEIHDIATLPAGNMTQMDFCFDQNMRPTAVFVIDDTSWLYYLQSSAYVFEKLSPVVKCPRLLYDKVLAIDTPYSDIHLVYCNEGKLCYRVQRERYLKEYVVATAPDKHLLWRVGLLRDGRAGFQWR